MKFLAWLADTIRFIFGCGGKLDLDLERSKFKCAYILGVFMCYFNKRGVPIALSRPQELKYIETNQIKF